jgi:hypothetical protein
MWFCLCVSVSHSDGSFFLLCCVSVCGAVCALVYPIVTGGSSVALYKSVCGTVCALGYPTVTGSYSFCVCLYVVPSVS